MPRTDRATSSRSSSRSCTSIPRATPRTTRPDGSVDELIDLEPVAAGRGGARAAVPPAVPARLSGLCLECGARLADDPEHAHDERVDPRWAALGRLDARRTTGHTPVRRRGVRRGCSEAEDVAQQHAAPPLPVEGHRALAGHLRQPGLPAPSTCRTGPAPSAGSTAPAASVARSSDPVDMERPTPHPAAVPHPTGPTCCDGARACPTSTPTLLEPRPDPPLVRVRERRAADQRAAGVPRRLGARPGRHRRRSTARHPDLSEGRLAKLRAAVVNARALAEVGADARPRRAHQLGRGEETTGGRDKSSILADTVEALIGAVYIAHGFDGAAGVVHRLFDPLIAAAATSAPASTGRPACRSSPPTLGLGVPEYLIEESGPDHEKTFTARVRVGEQRLRHGAGRSQEGGRAAGGRDRLATEIDRAARAVARAEPAPTATATRCAVPELPEVEVVRRGLERHVVGRTIARRRRAAPARRSAGTSAGAADFAARLRGRRPRRAAPPRQVPLAAADDRRTTPAMTPARPPRDERPAARAAARRRRSSGTCGCGFVLDDGPRPAVRRPAHVRRAARSASGGAELPAEIAHIARDPLDPAFDDDGLRRRGCAGGVPASSGRCSTRPWSPASATSTPTRRCGGPGCTTPGRPRRCAGPRSSGCWPRCAR